MIKIGIKSRIILAVIVSLVLIISLPAHAGTALKWYTGGQSKLNLIPITDDTSASVIFTGKTSQKTLVIKVIKKDGRTRSNHIPLSPEGEFSVKYLFKDGVGDYSVHFFGSEKSKASKYGGIGYLTHKVDQTLPANMPDLELNSKLLEFADKAMGTVIGRGECWDVAQEALDSNLADWARVLNFGIPVNPDTDVVKAGDIIQFFNLVITEHPTPDSYRRITLGSPDHTAIIYKVLGNRQFTLAHQNFKGNRGVTTLDVNLANTTAGSYKIFRPVAQMIKQ